MYYFAPVCGACIKNDGKLVKIHDLDIDNISYYNKLTLCLPNMNFDKNSVKTYLCQSCSDILRKMYDFRELCINSERILMAYVLQLEQSSSLKNSEQNTLNELLDNNYKDLITYRKEMSKSDLKLENIDSEIDKNVIKTETMDFEYVNVARLDSSLLNIKKEPVDIEPECQDYSVSFETTYEQDQDNHMNVNQDSSIQSPNMCESFQSEPRIEHPRIDPSDKPFKCDVCSKGFNRLHHLRVHKLIHSGEKRYECDICNKSFNRSDSLHKHKRIHTGEKPYQCDICYKSFNQSGHLHLHKRIHTGEKPYECDVCYKSFNQSGNLQLHKRIHTGEKVYECDVCNTIFNHSASLRAHKRTHI